MLKIRYFILLIVFVFVILNNNCINNSDPTDTTTNTNLIPSIPILTNYFAENITLNIYSNGWGSLLATTNMASEGAITINAYEQNPYGSIPGYFIFASASNSFTKLYTCSSGESINVDLDGVGTGSNAMAGVIFCKQSYFSPKYVANRELSLYYNNSYYGTMITDSLGRYSADKLPVGNYKLLFSYNSYNVITDYSFDISNSNESNYKDISFYDPVQIAKPNIYLYPISESNIDVKVSFNTKGKITNSIPEYGSGWSVNVKPNGTINNQYGYLFYEVDVTPIIQSEYGWCISKSNLNSSLRNILSEYGFNQTEINDFMEYWIPRFAVANYYLVYPQDSIQVEKMTSININPKPDNILRVEFVVRPIEKNISIQAPVINSFNRTGFSVTEWGVFLGLEK